MSEGTKTRFLDWTTEHLGLFSVFWNIDLSQSLNFWAQKKLNPMAYFWTIWNGF